MLGRSTMTDRIIVTNRAIDCISIPVPRLWMPWLSIGRVESGDAQPPSLLQYCAETDQDLPHFTRCPVIVLLKTIEDKIIGYLEHCNNLVPYTGAPGGIRTHNHLLRRQVLYPLSYRGKGKNHSTQGRMPLYTLAPASVFKIVSAGLPKRSLNSIGVKGIFPFERKILNTASTRVECSGMKPGCLAQWVIKTCCKPSTRCTSAVSGSIQSTSSPDGISSNAL